MSSRSAVRAAVLADLPHLAETVTADLRDQIPAYATLSPAQLAEVSAIATWGIGRILDLWVEDGDLSPADVARFEGIGAARALDGRPLAGVLRAYRLAGRSLTGLVTTLAGDTLTVADAMALANLWMATIDTLSEALYDGHARASDRLSDDRDRALADLLADLLTGRQVTITALADRSRQLGVTLPPRPAVLVVEPTATTTTTLEELLAAVGLAHDDDVLRAVRGRRWVVVGGDEAVRAVSDAVPTHGLRGCVTRADRASDVHRASQLADLALDRAPDHAHTAHPVLGEGDAHVLALLAASPLADPARAVACVLGEVSDPAHAHLLQGLDAYLAHGSATAAADHLGLHAQTMRYRLRRVRELTGRDLRDPWDRFVVEAARRTSVVEV